MSETHQTLIVPIAHYVGQDYDVDKDAPTYNLRGGWDVVELTEAERTIWFLAAGVPQQINEDKPWTRDALREAATPFLADADLDAIINDLLARDILAEFTPGTPQAIEFASKYRLVPLQIGLGNTREEPWAYRIGIGDNVLLTLSGTPYTAWEWCHLYQNLWDFCRNLAKIREGHTDPPAKPEDKDPEKILTEVLLSLHHLLTSSCAYLDVPHDWGTA
jgi:hypothetical protein